MIHVDCSNDSSIEFPGNNFIYRIVWAEIEVGGWASSGSRMVWGGWRCYSPGFPWYGYGDTEQEALKMMREIVEREIKNGYKVNQRRNSIRY